jgi:hypothetical protein
MLEVYNLQKRHPDAGGFRIWSLLERTDLSVRTVERIMALNRQVYDGSIPCFFGGFYPGRAWSCCRERAKIRSKVPLYLAQRRASMWLALVTYHHAPERLRRTWQMNLLADSIPPLPMG